MATIRDEFLRRYAASPIHVPRLERLLNAYGNADEDESFPRRFIAWDRACRDVDAARIVTEIISVNVDASGRIVRVSDEAVNGAIRWMAEATWHAVADRARILGEALAARDGEAGTKFIELLEASGTLDDLDFRAAAEKLSTTTSPRLCP